MPAELSSFVGRERELATVAALLATERLVTLTGPAGIGKTRIAVRAVRAVQAVQTVRAVHGVVWADLGGLPEDRWAALEGELLDVVAGRDVLLVLDGCEQLGDLSAGLAAELLLRCPRLRILATSQRRLGTEGEAVLAVPPLGVPPAGAVTTSDSSSSSSSSVSSSSSSSSPSSSPSSVVASASSVLPASVLPLSVGPLPAGPGGWPSAEDAGARARIAEYPAVRLFVERARGADPFFEITRRNADHVVRLCRALDGIPGALELAAGRLHQYAPEQALRKLAADPLALLTGGAGRGSRADAERSHRLCSPTEQLLWERLSVFAGSFDRTAVEAVCGFGRLGRAAAGAALAGLASGLLLDAGPGRYRLPLSVRAHAARRLVARGEQAEAARRHHAWYGAVADRAARLWQGGHQREARALALRELPDLCAAMNPMAGSGPGPALEIAVSLWFLWVACGLLAEGRRHLERALALHPAPRPARALWLTAWIAACLGECDGADPLLVEGWTAAVHEGEDASLAYLGHVRGTVAVWELRTREAVAEFAEALELLPAEPGFGPGRAALVASYTLALARVDPAAVPVEDGPSELPDDAWARSWIRYAHASVLRLEARAEAARAELLRALEAQLALGDLLGLAASGELLAAVVADLGRHQGAARLLGAVDRIRAAFLRDARAVAYWARGRAPREALLRARLTEPVFERAYEAGARAGLGALVGEVGG
ncbi:ATP-binding protein [Streptomyces sp. NPDC093225]|uniref:ATP-binding protein n=1 Tax=Streptomyces sp. NPDC093225 TaxID=3366034 RepID=UPI00381E43B5